MEIDYVAIGARVRYFRKEQNLTQAKLGERAGVEPFTISHIERGATKVSLPTLVRLANSLGASLDELMYDSLNENTHIIHRHMNELLSDCSTLELKQLTQAVRVIKEILREEK